MKNLKLRMKLFISLAIIIVVVLVLGITSFLSIGNMNEQIATFTQRAIPNTKYAQQIQTEIERIQVSMLRAIVETDPALIADELSTMDEKVDGLNDIISIYRQTARVDESLIVALENEMSKLLNTASQISDLTAVGDIELNLQSFEMYKNDFRPALEEVKATLDTMVTSQEDIIQKQVEEANRVETLVSVLIIVILIGVIIISMIVVVTLSHMILTPLKEVLYAMNEMAEGRVSNAVVEYQSKDEFGEIADGVRNCVSILRDYITRIDGAMHRMSEGDFTIETTGADFKGDFSSIQQSILKFMDKISATLRTVAESSVQVSSGASQVSSGAQALSQGTTEQASSVEELSATITEISNQVSQNADNAVQANKQASQVENEASESSDRMKNMLRAMEDISDSSKEIGNIIKTIEDIAFQTNILALNAAVEAARAGAAGKGFAVVADEVRTLAGRSAEASKNTALLIENSVKAVKNGEDIANQTAESLNAVVGGVQEVADIINKISVASKDQSAAISQVTLGMEQISAVIQTNSATAQQSAAASEELSSQSDMLKSLIAQFKLKGGPAAMEDTMVYKPIELDNTYNFEDHFDSKY